jgi:hypothetical protein
MSTAEIKHYKSRKIKPIPSFGNRKRIKNTIKSEASCLLYFHILVAGRYSS